MSAIKSRLVQKVQRTIASDDKHDEARGQEILDCFSDAFGHLLSKAPDAFKIKFRKMAGSSFAFYRGSACLFYHDLGREPLETQYINDRTGRIWIHGDLHAENFGTYMNSQGRLIFNVNDFDEAYVGPFLWDLKRFAASIALLGYSKALSDNQITDLVKAYAKAYLGRINQIVTAEDNGKDIPSLTLDTAKGPLLDALRTACKQTRAGILDSMTEIDDGDAQRRFTTGGQVQKLDHEQKKKVLSAYEGYLKTLPQRNFHRPNATKVKDVVGRQGVGIGSGGLPSYNLLLEGNTEALENDVVIFMKQSQKSAVSPQIQHEATQRHFKHEGHRTAISERALQAHADPWLGWAEMDGAGWLVAEVSPYAVDLEWDDINDPEEMASVVADLGEVTATMHAVGDQEDSKQSGDLVPFSSERAIHEVIANDEEGLTKLLVDFAHSYGAKVRRDHHIFVDMFRNGQIPGL